MKDTLRYLILYLMETSWTETQRNEPERRLTPADLRERALTPADLRERAVITVEEAGNLLGVARSGAYAAVKRGEIPTVRIGRRLVVPTATLLRMLGVPSDAPAA